jgi:hypothetical protein
VGGGVGEGTRHLTLPRLYLVIYSVYITCKGDPYLENGAQRRLGAEDFVCLGFARRDGGRFPLSVSTYLFGVNGL